MIDLFKIIVVCATLTAVVTGGVFLLGKFLNFILP